MKNISYNISTLEGENYRPVYSIRKMYEYGLINEFLPDGIYPFVIKEASFFSIHEIPEMDDVTLVPCRNYPEFTDMILTGFLEVRRGRLIVSSIDGCIPHNYGRWNNHVFLEGLYVDMNQNTIRLLMGS